MAWMIPENKLDPQQREFLDNVDFTRKNVWIKGFAGSGKSILLLYAARKILLRFPSSKLILVVFTRSLVEMFEAAFKEIKLNVIIDTYYGFERRMEHHYDYILCDEVQDLTPRVIQLMNSRCSHLIVAGDSNQSIYDCDPQRREPTVTSSEIGTLINGNAFELGIIHRLSRSIIDAVQRFLPRMNIFSSKRDMTKEDTQIRLCEARSEEEEVSYIMKQATKSVNAGYTSAVLIPTHDRIITFVNQALKDAGKNPWLVSVNRWGKPDFEAMNQYLQSNGIKLQYVGNGYGSFSENDHRIVLMTFHSVKGLDFENVFIPFASAGMFISNNESLARTLFMVAMTRSRNNLYITYYGYPNDYLESFKSNCSHIDISSASTSTTQSSTTENDNFWGF